MLICQCNAMHRRDVMCGGGAAVFTAIIATLMGSSKPVKAEAISGAVPELDSVAVRVVVDSYHWNAALHSASRFVNGLSFRACSVGRPSRHNAAELQWSPSFLRAPVDQLRPLQQSDPLGRSFRSA